MAIARRIAPLTGTEARRQLVASQIEADEFHTTNDQVRAFLENQYLGPVEHGTVADEAAMLALNVTSPRGVWPGDQCLRADVGVMFTCITNHGETAPDWCPAVSTLPGNPSTGDVTIPALPGSSYTTLDRYLDVTQSPGVVTGCGLSNGGGLLCAVAAGTAVIRIANSPTAQLVTFNFAGGTIAVPNDNVVHYIALSYNAGSPILIIGTSPTFNNTTEINLGSAVVLGGAVLATSNPFKVGDAVTNVIRRFDSIAPTNRDVSIGGLLLGETGTRNITLTAGQLWARLTATPVAAKNTSTGSTMTSVYYSGAAWVFTPAVTQWDNLQFNNIATGLVTMGNNRYANLWFYLLNDTTTIFMQYGQAEYNNFAQALAEARPSFTPPNAPYVTVLLGRLIFQKNAATAQQIQSAFTSDFAGTVVTNHNDLANIQGGTIGEYFHLTNVAYSNISAGPLATPTFARLDIINPGSSGIINIDSDATAASLLRFYRAATVKWSLRNSSTDIFDIFNDGLLQSAISIQPATNAITIPGSITAGSIQNTPIGNITPSTGKFTTVTADTTTIDGVLIKVNVLGSGNRYAAVDLIGDDTYTDYASRFIRLNTGPNAATEIQHHGTGELALHSQDGANIAFKISGVNYGLVTTTGFQGPIGATTPRSGAFNGLSSIVSGASIAAIFGSDNSDAQIRINNTAPGGDLWSIGVGATASGLGESFYIYNQTDPGLGLLLTSTGINSTPIGATTPSTGAFTNASVSGVLRLNTGFAVGVPLIYLYEPTYGLGIDTTGHLSIFANMAGAGVAFRDSSVGGTLRAKISNAGLVVDGIGSFSGSGEFGGGINGTPIGNVTPSTVKATTLQTDAPSGGTAQAWKLGNVTVAAAAQTRTVRVEIAGVAYDLLAA